MNRNVKPAPKQRSERTFKVLRVIAIALAVVGVLVSTIGAWLCNTQAMNFGTPFIIAELLVVGAALGVRRAGKAQAE